MLHPSCSQNGGTLDTKTLRGTTPVLAAASEGKLAMLEYLVQQGCELDDRNVNGDDAVLLAASAGEIGELCGGENTRPVCVCVYMCSFCYSLDFSRWDCSLTSLVMNYTEQTHTHLQPRHCHDEIY